jgi:hypothetical protein
MMKMMVIALLVAAAAPAPAGGNLVLARCEFGQIDVKTMKLRGPARPFAVLLPAAPAAGGSASAAVRVLDPTNLLMGLSPLGAAWDGDGKMVYMETNKRDGTFFRLGFSVRPGKWAGSIGMNGGGTPAYQLAHSYMGSCMIDQTPGAVAAFDALERRR